MFSSIAKFKQKVPMLLVLTLAVGFIGLLVFSLRVPAGVGAGGSGFSGRPGTDIQDIFGTKLNPIQGATSTLGQLEPPNQTTTSTHVIFLQNADTVTFHFDMTATTTVSNFNWYFEVSNAADCEVDGPWAIRATSTEMIGADFNTTPGNATPTDILTPGIIGSANWTQTISNLNSSCLRITGSFASSTDDSFIHVSASLK